MSHPVSGNESLRDCWCVIDGPKGEPLFMGNVPEALARQAAALLADTPTWADARCGNASCSCMAGTPEREPDGWIAGRDAGLVARGLSGRVYGERRMAGFTSRPVYIDGLPVTTDGK